MKLFSAITTFLLAQVYVRVEALAAPSTTVYKPVEEFLIEAEEIIAQGNIKEFERHVNEEIDLYMQSVEHLPRAAFDTLFNFNAKTLNGSRLPEPLKRVAVDYLRKLKGDYFVHFNKEVADKALAVKNYKILMGNIDRNEKGFREKILEQAPIIAASLNDNLVALSGNLKGILTLFMNEIYTISIDTLKNEATNWRMTEDNNVVWVVPEAAHQHLIMFNTTEQDQLQMPSGPLPGTQPFPSFDPNPVFQPFNPNPAMQSFNNPMQGSFNDGLQGMNTAPPSPGNIGGHP